LAEGEEEEEGGKKKPALPAEEEDDNDDDPEKLAAKKARPRDVQQLRLAPFFLAPGARKGKITLLFFFFFAPCTLLRVGALVASQVGAEIGYGVASVRGLRVRGLLLTAVQVCPVRVREDDASES
jgi:hypothetical protein